VRGLLAQGPGAIVHPLLREANAALLELCHLHAGGNPLLGRLVFCSWSLKNSIPPWANPTPRFWTATKFSVGALLESRCASVISRAVRLILFTVSRFVVVTTGISPS
jgi:hypothetical protein